MPVDFGKCISAIDDLPLRWAYVSGQRLVAEAVARRWGTERGSLPYARDYGTDSRGIIGETLTPSQIAEWATSLEREAEKDERVTAASVSVVYDPASARATITAALSTAEAGTFTLVVAVDELSAQLLEVV